MEHQIIKKNKMVYNFIKNHYKTIINKNTNMKHFDCLLMVIYFEAISIQITIPSEVPILCEETYLTENH